MTRSNYKLPFVHKSLFVSTIEKKKDSEFKLNLNESLLFKKNVESCYFFFKRNSRFTSELVGKKIAIYNGNNFVIYNVNEDSLEFKLGEFSVTRKKPKHAGKLKQSKKVEKVQKLTPGEISASIRMTVRKPKTYHKRKKGSLRKKKVRTGKKYR